jgi:hypothetical protein
VERIRAFLDRVDLYADNMGRHVRDGLREAVEALERYLRELAPSAARETVSLEAVSAGSP